MFGTPKVLGLDVGQLRDLWRRTQDARAQVQCQLESLGLSQLIPPRMAANERIVSDDDQRAVSQLLSAMRSISSPEYEGFSVLDLRRALVNEAALRGAFARMLEGTSFRQFAAFKANHSLVLQYARLCVDPQAGIEVASLEELIQARSLGFAPEHIVFFSPAFSERELVVAYALGVRSLCIDHLAKLELVLDACAAHGLDHSQLRVLARVAAPYAAAGLSMDRFGLDVGKNPAMAEAFVAALERAGTSLAGISFHVGMGARSTRAYDVAFAAAAELFELCEGRGMELPRIIDVGGGFPFNDTSVRYRGAISLSEQLGAIARGVAGLRARFGGPLEVWSESGQGYVGDAGATFVRVNFDEQRQCPRRKLPLAAHAPGTLAWFQTRKQVFALREQWLVTLAGAWSYGVSRYTTIQPELWGIDPDGSSARVEVEDEELIPTLVFGKTCDPLDALNPMVEGELVRVLLPDLSRLRARHPGRSYALRLPFAAYADTCGNFNGQTVRQLPRHHLLGPELSAGPDAPYLCRELARIEVGDARGPLEYRDRMLEPGVLSAAQIEAAKTLAAEQFSAREQMSAWLRDTGQLDEHEHQTLRHLFRLHAARCVGEGLSMVRLELPPGAPDHRGEVVGVIAVKRFDASEAPQLPLAQINDYECRRSRVMFEIEAQVLRRLLRLDGGLREKLLPMAYLAMSAKARGRGPSIRSLRAKVIELARAAEGIKSLASLTTGARSSAVAAAIPGSFVMMRIPYDEIRFQGRRPFAGLRFGDTPGELRVHMHDLRGPERFADPLPRELRFGIEIGERSWLGQPGSGLL